MYKDEALQADKLKADNGDRYACIRLIDQLLKKSGPLIDINLVDISSLKKELNELKKQFGNTFSTVLPNSGLAAKIDYIEKMIINFEYDHPFFKEAFKYCLLSAEKYEDPEGMWRLGWRYWLGEGTALDKGKAIQWWKKAAYLNFLMAAERLDSLGIPLKSDDIVSFEEKTQRKKTLNAIRKLVQDGNMEEGMKRFLQEKKDKIFGVYIDEVTRISSSLHSARKDFNGNLISLEAYIQIRDKKLASFIDVLSVTEEQIENE